MADLRLTDLTQATGITINDLLHIVIPTDISQDPAGSSYKASVNQLYDGLSGYCIPDLYVSNLHSCSPLNINPLDEGNIYFGSTSGITIDVINKRIGLNTSNPEYLIDFFNSSNDARILFIETSNVRNFRLTGATNNLTMFGVSSPSTTGTFGGIDVGIRGSLDPTWAGYGKVGDTFVYSSNQANGLNLISRQGTGTEDYIRFYAGQDANGTTPDIHIQGSGSTRGYVGIGTSSPTEKLEVSGNTLINGTLSATTISATTYQNLPTKEVFYKSHSANESLVDLGGFFEPAYNGGVSPVYISGIIPYDFGSNISSEIILISTASETQTIELNFSSGPVGGSFSATTANISFPKTYTQNIVDTVNVDNFFSGITANQVFSLNVVDNSGNYKLVIGIKFKYKPV